MKKAIVLLSGGLDSTTTLFYAQKKGYDVTALIFDYGQRHVREVRQAKKIARYARCPFEVVSIRLPWKGSSLLDKKVSIPRRRSLKDIDAGAIPSTYVPARNIIFLSFAVSFAETIGARVIFIGANIRDYSGYPDCRPEFLNAFENVMHAGTKSGVEKKKIVLKAPLLKKTKKQIIALGIKLDVPYQMTWSCYTGGKRPCGVCDSCQLRQKGFSALQIEDPIYADSKHI